MRALVLAALLLAATVTGCATDEEETIEALTVAELRAVADRHANQQREDAELGAVFTLVGDRELAIEHMPITDEQVPALPEEGAGEGRPPAWLFLYRVDDRKGLAVLVHPNGILLETRDRGPSEGAAIRDWAIGPARADELAAEAVDGWPSAEDRAIIYSLSQPRGHERPMWVLATTSPEGETATARIDARSGGHLGPIRDRSQTGFLPALDTSTCQPSKGSHAGSVEFSLDAREPSRNKTVYFPGPCYETLLVRLELDDPAAGHIDATLLAFEPRLNLSADPITPEDEDAWQRALGGRHSLAIELAEGAHQEITVHWCGLGTGQAPPANPACPRQEG